MSITVYTFEDKEGPGGDSFTTTDPDEARRRGQRYGMRVIANEYEWADQEVAWDYTVKEQDA